MKNGRAPVVRGPWLWSLALAVVGVVWLLHNFLLLGDFNLLALLPLLLVVLGAQVLLRGDVLPSAAVKTFGITRGSVESAALVVNAGEIDVEVGALQREGRLIAGQYAPQSRPALQVDGTHTTLRMDRAMTPWLFFADWQFGLAKDLPWGVYVSTHLGQINLDLSEVIVQEAVIASGFGDVRLVAPREAFAPLSIRSALGSIHVITPPDYYVRISVKTGRMFRVYASDRRYRELEPGVYLALDADESLPLVDITISGTFGDAYLG